MARQYPNDAMQQLREILEGWRAIEGQMTINGITLESFATKLTAVEPVLARIVFREAELTNDRNLRDDMLNDLWKDAKRIRAGVKANFGDDSSEFEMVGGTRISERKPPTRIRPTPQA